MIFKRFSIALVTLVLIFQTTTRIAFAQATLTDINTVFENAIRWLAILGGFLAFLALIIGGFKYMTARGDPKAISGAQNTITWAIIGLIFIIVAWLILVFIENFTGQPVTQFLIQSPFPD